MKCQACHRNVNKKDKFCGHCGAAIQHQKVQPASPAATRSSSVNWPIVIGAIVFGIALGAVVMYFSGGFKSSAARASGFDPTLRGDALAAKFPQVYEVASQFICPCGTCTDGLEVCDCEMTNGAAEVRGFIYTQLTQGGHNPSHVIEMVEQRWGHRKGTSAPDFDKFTPQLQPLLPK